MGDMKNSPPMIVAGHVAECGADTSEYDSVGGSELAAPTENAVWLSVDFSPPCAVDAKFTHAVYVNL